MRVEKRESREGVRIDMRELRKREKRRSASRERESREGMRVEKRE